ncbi:MAG: RNA polymerase sigma factor [Desulfohalobiaceae bacterium]
MEQKEEPEKLDKTVLDDAFVLQSWVRRARSGERSAFERLVEWYQERVYRLVYYRIRSRADAQELTQDVFLKAYKNLPRLKEDGKFKSWLFSIAVNRARDHLRRKKLVMLFSDTRTDEERIEDINPSQRSQGAAQQLARKQFWAQVERLSRQLSRREKEVFMLRFMDELGIREIAEVIGQSESTVKTHLYRAIRKYQKDGSLKEYLLRGEP